ncbi:hypothetical protein BT96DRAFT_930043 [Gymnopus androsaceus JB14]|uniref:Uncharacterized protein n=1 Tax=Gymnopus androsaceus JB14 TaxID=1447944 RepID=A0A6A4GC11_9AGAR|nr:hypothetical protein BT96DRAFT_930043 [Gymnopus androsaceus JB14]
MWEKISIGYRQEIPEKRDFLRFLKRKLRCASANRSSSLQQHMYLLRIGSEDVLKWCWLALQSPMFRLTAP